MKRLLLFITLAFTHFAHGQAIETDATAKEFWENLSNIPTAPLDAATKSSLRAVIGVSEVKSASFAALDLGNYVSTATLTVTDPAPSEGARFSVLVSNGTATIGGTAYSVAGTIVERVYRSASWTNYSYQVASSFEASGASAAAEAAATAAAAIDATTKDTALLNSLAAGTIPAVTGTITITSPTTNSARQYNRDITIAGTYTVSSGTLSHIQYRFKGGDWRLLTSTPSGGAFSGSVRIEPGVGTLEVRLNNSASVGSITGFLSGNIFVILGQSNANGSGQNLQTYTGQRGCRMHRNGAWNSLTVDPVGATSSGGSPYPLLATMLEDQTGIPVAYVVGRTEGGTNLVGSPSQWSAPSGNNFTLSVTQINLSGINSAAAMLWYQGEGDAKAGVFASAYASALSAMVDGFQSSCAALAGVPLIATVIGESDTATDFNTDFIRQGLLSAISSDADILPGPLAHAVFDPADDLHWYSNRELLRLARMWCRTIMGNLTGGESPNGAQIISQTLSGDTLTVIFDREMATSTSATGWEIRDNGGTVTISSVSISGDTGVFVASRNFAGPTTLSYGRGESAKTSVLTDIGIVSRMPVAPLYSRAVGTGGGTVTSSLRTGMIAWWKLDETTGNRLDSHTNAIPLVPSGGVGVGFESAKFSNGARIAAASNTGGKLSATDTAAMDFTNGFSFSGWIRLSNNSNVITLFEKASEATVTLGGGVITAELRNGGSGRSGIIGSAQTQLYDNALHHVVVSLPSANPQAGEIYIDGVRVTSTTSYGAPGYTAWVNTANPINIGTVGNGGDPIKTFDEVSIYGRHLTEEEVAILYNAGTGITYP